MNDWKKVKLGDIATLNYGKGLITAKRKKGNVPVYSSAGITGFHNEALVESKGIIIGRKGTVGSIFYSNTPFYCIDTAYYILPNDNVYNFKYLYYVLKILGLNTLNEDSAVPGLNRETAYNQKFSLPPLETQEKIAAILGCLDDKIEINNKINANLENQAQTIFKHYFVDNKEKENLKKIELGKYCNVKSGFAFKSSWWKNKGVKVIKIKNINEDGSLDIKDCSYVYEDKKDLAKEFIVKGGDLLIAMTGATIGKFAIVPNTKEILLVNQRVGKFFLGNEPLNKLPFIYCALRQDDIINQIINKGQGSAQPNISSSDIETITLLIPNEDTINEFNLLTRHHFEMIINNHYETQKLINLRDTLLPKLMNGEINV